MSTKYQRVKRVLVVRWSNVADVLHTLPACQYLTGHLKGALVDYLTSSLLQELLVSDKSLNKIITCDDRSLDGLFRLAQRLSAYQYDLIINLQPDIKGKFFSMVLDKRYSIGYKRNSESHAVEEYFTACQKVFPEAVVPDKLTLPLHPKIIDWAKNTLVTEKISHCIGLVVEGKENKLTSWPYDNWLSFLDYLCNQKHVNVLLFGNDADRKAAQGLQQVNIKRIRNYCGSLSISQTAALLSLCMLVVGTDSGLTHLATAVGPRVIGLYGNTSPCHTGLYGPQTEMILSPHECGACNKSTCKRSTQDDVYAPCMSAIAVDKVISRVGL